MELFKDISMDVRQLISINEKLHNSVLRGTPLNHDEIDLVLHCAKQLLDLAERTGEREKVFHPRQRTLVMNYDRGLG